MPDPFNDLVAAIEGVTAAINAQGWGPKSSSIYSNLAEALISPGNTLLKFLVKDDDATVPLYDPETGIFTAVQKRPHLIMARFATYTPAPAQNSELDLFVKWKRGEVERLRWLGSKRYFSDQGEPELGGGLVLPLDVGDTLEIWLTVANWAGGLVPDNYLDAQNWVSFSSQ